MARSVVVTGATSGIGRAIALELATGGFDVIGTARDEHKAALLAEEAARRGARVRTAVLDVTDAESCVRAFTGIAAMTDGGPWAVVNNAGGAWPGAIEDVEDEAAHAQFEANVFAPARITRLVLPTMRQRGEGRIVNISSLSVHLRPPFLGWYCASKQALAALTDALRVEAAPFGVRAVLIEPGGFGTDIWRRAAGALPDRQRSAYRASYRLADRMAERAATMPSPEPVARTVRRALEAARPRTRYRVGATARSGPLLDAVMPTPLSDYAIEVAFGLRTAPRGVRRTAAFLGARGPGR